MRGEISAYMIYLEGPEFWCVGTTPILEKRSENAGANENLSFESPLIPGIAPGVAPRIVVFVLLKSWDAIPRMEFCIPRAAPRIPQNSPRAPRMAFHSESVFPDIGVVPRLQNIPCGRKFLHDLSGGS